LKSTGVAVRSSSGLRVGFAGDASGSCIFLEAFFSFRREGNWWKGVGGGVRAGMRYLRGMRNAHSFVGLLVWGRDAG
jgi:hypothetical protein